MIKNKPKLIVFDLDSTLWALGIDDFYYQPPYKRGSKILGTEENQKETYRVFDREGKEMKPFPEVNSVLHYLKKEKYRMAVASRTTYPTGAFNLLDLYNWTDYFEVKEIYPGQKFAHFNTFKNETKVKYEDMLFFDDEDRNIRDISSINVTCIKIDPNIGMNFDYLKKGFEEHSNKIEKRTN